MWFDRNRWIFCVWAVVDRENQKICSFRRLLKLQGCQRTSFPIKLWIFLASKQITWNKKFCFPTAFHEETRQVTADENQKCPHFQRSLHPPDSTSAAKSLWITERTTNLKTLATFSQKENEIWISPSSLIRRGFGFWELLTWRGQITNRTRVARFEWLNLFHWANE